VVPPNRENPSVVAQIRGDRTFPAEVAIAGAAAGRQPLPSGEVVVGNRAFPSEVDAKVLLADHRGAAAKQGNRAAAALQAVKAHPQEGAVAPEAVVAVVLVVVAAAVAGDDNHWIKIINIVNYKFDGGESDAY